MPSNQKQTKNNWQKRIYSLSWSNFLFLPFLLLSSLFWLSTELSNELQYKKVIHVDFLTESDMILKDQMDDKLLVSMKGKGWDLFFMRRFGEVNPFGFMIPKEMKEIRKTDLLSQLNVVIDNSNILITDINFSEKIISQEKKISKRVGVIFNGDLKFETFYKLGEAIDFIPGSITITGPISEVERIDSYPTSYTKVDRISEGFEQKVILIPPEKHYLTIHPKEVLMKIRAEQLTQKSLRIPVKIANKQDHQVTIVPESIEISFLIGLSEFQSIEGDDFVAQIVIPELMSPDQQYAVSIVKKPSSAVIQEIQPAYVDVFIDKESGNQD